MHLTSYTDYALRVLVYVGLKGGEIATIAEIAERFGISRNHLMKIVHRLGTLGYLRTTRGKGGGIRLARPPGRIRVGDVVRAMEEDLTIVECFGLDPVRCRIEPACVLRDLFGRALRAFFAELDRHTLADLLAPEDRLVRLLELQRPSQ